MAQFCHPIGRILGYVDIDVRSASQGIDPPWSGRRVSVTVRTPHGLATDWPLGTIYAGIISASGWIKAVRDSLLLSRQPYAEPMLLTVADR